MKNVQLLLVLCCSLYIFSGCSSEDVDRFYIEDLQLIHGNNSKTWKIEAFYNNYEADRLSDFNECYKDDLFTFEKGNSNAIVTLGPISCYWDQPTDAYTSAEYTYYEDDGTIYIRIGKGEVNGNFFSNKSFPLKLMELSENKMIFASPQQEYYGETIIFVTE